MKNKTCGECRFHDKDDQCSFVGFTRPASLGACRNFEPEPTVFDRITLSPEVLAPEFVEMMYDRVSGDYRYYSMLTGEFYNNREEAIAATVAKLKEVGE